jgi:hypothetical protein
MSDFGDQCEAAFTQMAHDLFKQNPVMTKTDRDGQEFHCIEIPLSGGRWVKYEAMWGSFEDVGRKLVAHSWFELCKPEGAPHLPLDPREIEDYIVSSDELRRRIGYFARALAKTDYRYDAQSARAAVRNLQTIDMDRLQNLRITQ